MELKYRNLLKQDAWINGKAAPGTSRFDVFNPFDESRIAEVTDCGPEEAEEAVGVAAEAWKGWKQKSLRSRSGIIRTWARSIRAHREDLSRIVIAEQGKVQSEALGEIDHSAAMMDWFAEECLRGYGHTVPANGSGQRNFIVREPLGVVGAVTPWNFPVAAVTAKCMAAIAAGCTVVLKPSDETPLIALTLAALGGDSGLPEGVFNVLPCKDPLPVGEILTRDPRIRAFSFTGSTSVGRRLTAQCAETMKKVSMELGGNAPFIVLDDADLERAVADAVRARYYNNGQICIGANRFFVHDNLYDSFVTKLAEKAANLRQGPGSDPDTDLGPMINRASLEKVESLVEKSVAMGARVVTGGSRGEPGGLFYRPTVLRDVTPAMPVYRAEVFGPVSCVYRFSDEDEVLERANETEYGLAAYVYSGDQKKLWEFAARLEFGMVGANTANITSPDLPFGGMKQSGLGREGGAGCLDEFMETKTFCLGL